MEGEKKFHVLLAQIKPNSNLSNVTCRVDIQLLTCRIHVHTYIYKLIIFPSIVLQSFLGDDDSFDLNSDPI